LPKAIVAGAAGGVVAALLALGLPKVMWLLWKGELLGFISDALDTTIGRRPC